MIGTTDDTHEKRLNRIKILNFIIGLSQQRDIFTPDGWLAPFHWGIANKYRLSVFRHSLVSFLVGLSRMNEPLGIEVNVKKVF